MAACDEKMDVTVKSNDDAQPDTTSSSGLPSPPSSGTTTPKLRIAPCPPRLTPQIPPTNFAAATDGKLYRSAFPEKRNIEFLLSLNIKSILCLVENDGPDAYCEWIADKDINRRHVKMASNKDGNINTTWDSICEALLFAMDSARYPLYIHCNQGKHRTGCVIGCLRKLAGMHIDTIIHEYEVYSGIKARPADKELIRQFEPKMVLEYAKQQGKFEDKEFMNRIEHAFNGGLDDLLSSMGSRRASDGIDSMVTEWSSPADHSSDDRATMRGKVEREEGQQDLDRPVLERTMSDLTLPSMASHALAEELDQGRKEVDVAEGEATATSVIELGDDALTPPAA